jgi:chaperonin cofactor prefoldin
MLIEKKRIRQIIKDHELTCIKGRDEDELVNIFYESLSEMASFQEERLATKEDIKMVLELMNRRFEAVDRRFEAVDKRFEAIDKRFEAIDKRFEDMYKYMDKRFESVDKRFESVNKRFEDMNKKFSMMFTFMNIGFGIIILLTVLFKFLH